MGKVKSDHLTNMALDGLVNKSRWEKSMEIEESNRSVREGAEFVFIRNIYIQRNLITSQKRNGGSFQLENSPTDFKVWVSFVWGKSGNSWLIGRGYVSRRIFVPSSTCFYWEFVPTFPTCFWNTTMALPTPNIFSFRPKWRSTITFLRCCCYWKIARLRTPSYPSARSCCSWTCSNIFSESRSLTRMHKLGI
mgnify:CR=1 FL=1